MSKVLYFTVFLVGFFLAGVVADQVTQYTYGLVRHLKHQDGTRQ